MAVAVATFARTTHAAVCVVQFDAVLAGARDILNGYLTTLTQFTSTADGVFHGMVALRSGRVSSFVHVPFLSTF